MRKELFTFIKNGIEGLKKMSNEQAESMNGYKDFILNDFLKIHYTEDFDFDGKFLWVEIMLSKKLNGNFEEVTFCYALNLNDDIDLFLDNLTSEILKNKIYLSDAILLEIDPEDRYNPFGGELEGKYNYCQVYAVSNVKEDYKQFPFSVKIKLYNSDDIEDVNDCVLDCIKTNKIS